MVAVYYRRQNYSSNASNSSSFAGTFGEIRTYHHDVWGSFIMLDHRISYIDGNIA